MVGRGASPIPIRIPRHQPDALADQRLGPSDERLENWWIVGTGCLSLTFVRR